MIENDPMWKQINKPDDKWLHKADYYFIAAVCFAIGGLAWYLLKDSLQLFK